MRNEILKSVFSRKSYENSQNLTSNDRFTHIDCFTGLGGFFSELVCDGNEQLGSYTIDANCDVCHKNKRMMCPLVPIFIDVEKPISLHDIQSILIADSRRIQCKNVNRK